MKDLKAGSPVAYPVSVARLPRTGTPVWLDADPDQRAILAREHDLLDVPRFRIDATVEPWKRGGVIVRGKVQADIVQACVVSLEPVPSVIDESFEAVLVPESSRLARPDRAAVGEIVLDAEGPDLPETFSGDHVDIGALAEEFFALAIDPYPRAPGAELDSGAAGGSGEGETEFARKLAGLARKQ